MALETGTYINQLVPSNPNGADPKGQGDDHIRLIKNTLKNTFPNIDKQVYANADHLNRIADPSMFFVRGMIMSFYGNAAPAGWAICDGQNGTPDLRSRFIYGAGLTHGPASVGGNTAHTHGAEVYGTALTEAQMPSHRHAVMASTDPIWARAAAPDSVPPGVGNVAGRWPGLATPYVGSGAAGQSWTYNDIEPKNGSPFLSNAGGNQAHTHGVGVAGSEHMPPFVALYFIMRL
uniref:Tail fiber protein n=3 Tax=unclassified bacterial viruses TaxID=12333 RepID=A0AAU6W0U9_9VIRU